MKKAADAIFFHPSSLCRSVTNLVFMADRNSYTRLSVATLRKALRKGDTMKKRCFAVVICLILFVGSMSGCQPKTPEKTVTISADYPEYDSVEALTDRADLIVQGTVKEMQYKQIDISLGKGRDDSLSPYTVYTVAVDEVFKSDGNVGETIEVKVPGGIFDGVAYVIEGVDSPLLEKDQSYVLFLATYENLPASLLNLTQAAYEIGEDGKLAGVESDSSIRLDFSIEDLRSTVRK